MYKLFKNKKIDKENYQKEKGFTMAELIVVIGIFTILTAVTVFNYGRFNNNIIMTNMAYEIALSIREAQVYSLGVRGSDNKFDTRYGVYFNVGNTGEGSQDFVFFADRNSSGKCEIDDRDENSDTCSINACIDGANNECENLNTLTRGINITEICVSETGNPIQLDEEQPNFGECVYSPVTEAAITFQRPNPNAFVSDISTNTEFKNAAIIIEANNDAKRAIYIRENGQISVEFINN